MQGSHFVIKSDKFEGPLDLLLSLIEKRKLLINEFSLAQITDDYIAYIQRTPEHTISKQADFILIASTLLLIKSRSLLPDMSLSSDEEENIDDLQKRLKLYSRIKDLSLHIKTLYLKHPLHFARDDKGFRVIFAPDKRLSAGLVHSSLLDAISKIPKKPAPEIKATIKKTISIEEMIDNLTERIKKAVRMSFREFTGGHAKNREEKVNVIVGFLALLEMVKQGAVGVRQEKTFEDIILETDEVTVPNYL